MAGVRACVCVCVNSRQHLGSNRASVMSDKLKKPENRSRKEGKYSTFITDISITLSDCLGQSKSGFSIPTPPLIVPTYIRTHVFACISIPNISTRKSFTTTSLRLVYKKIVSACVFVRELGFLRLNLTCPMETRATVWAQVLGVQRLF